MAEQRYTVDEWRAEAERRFGLDPMAWRFVCPACGHVATIREWKLAGATSGEVAFSCVGRHLEAARDAFAKGDGPCNYAGGGLFKLNPVTVVDEGREHDVFAFAPAPGEVGTFASESGGKHA